VLLVEVVLVLQVPSELVDGAIQQLLHRVIGVHHQRLQFAAHRIALAVGLLDRHVLFGLGLLDRPLLLAARLDLSWIEFSEWLLVLLFLATDSVRLLYVIDL
jgi:hypothetical protein